MSNKKRLTTLSIVGTAFVASLAASNIATAQQAGANPFAMTELSSGYMQVAEGKCGGDMKKGKKEGKCGEGKCGGDKKKGMKDGKCGGSMEKGAKEGKCGEGKCGEGMKKGKKGMEEGKCGGSKKKMKEGKCGS